MFNEGKTARNLWRVIEPYHQLAYRSPEAEEQYVSLGLHQPALRYFGSRLAAFGPVGHHTATALLFGFDPHYVGSAIPHVWDIATPQSITAARLTGAEKTLRRIIGNPMNGSEMREASTLAMQMVEGTNFSGRPMAAAHADQPWPDSPAMILWHACTILREHRGDAHWAATSAEGIDAVECHLLHAADGAMPADLLQRVTGWDDNAWSGATERLRLRKLINLDDLTLTSTGQEVKLRIERATDSAASQPISVIGDAQAIRLGILMRPWVDAIMDSGVIAAWKIREELWRD